MAETETVGDDRSQQPRRSPLKPSGSRIQGGSLLYTRLLPVILGALTVLTIALIVVAAGVLIGVIPFR
jgi:hypothetical protein